MKLSGMVQNLDMRLREAGENDLSHEQFLTQMVQDELAQRENNNLKRRLRVAQFGVEKTLEGFDFRFNSQALPAGTIRELATCRFIELKENVVIAGPPGIGKTHIAKAIGHQACRNGFQVLFKKAHPYIEELVNAKTFFKYEGLFKKGTQADLLILDDFGFRKMSIKEAEVFYSLIDERLGSGSTFVTSNRPAADWISIFPDAVMGGAILDRLVSGARKMMATTKAKSHRREGPKEEPQVDKGDKKR